ncbi:YhcH/YjgK/YiaL family protein [Martelella mangrovi]|uniref:YhcH/YjgK/YiaL family protein n=1 Tax=Martelella mangrovi TaxID=1397477 RepID=A0ABV2ICJ4_9HYPH
MIFGRLDNVDLEKATLPDAVLEGLQFLNETDLANASEGRIDIDGDRIFASVQDYTTGPQEEKRPESHIRYLDIQYIVSGREMIGVAPLSTTPPAAEDLSGERDLLFYDQVGEESSLVLSAGSYAVFYPWDVHRPGCAVGETGEAVRKVVVKIRM